MAGTVFVLTSDYYQKKNIYKIGSTKSKLAKRLFAMNASFPTADLMFYCVHQWSAPVSDCRKSEKMLHEHFAHNRLRGEFFRLTQIDLEQLVGIMEEYSDESCSWRSTEGLYKSAVAREDALTVRGGKSSNFECHGRKVL